MTPTAPVPLDGERPRCRPRRSSPLRRDPAWACRQPPVRARSPPRPRQAPHPEPPRPRAASARRATAPSRAHPPRRCARRPRRGAPRHTALRGRVSDELDGHRPRLAPDRLVPPRGRAGYRREQSTPGGRMASRPPTGAAFRRARLSRVVIIPTAPHARATGRPRPSLPHRPARSPHAAQPPPGALPCPWCHAIAQTVTQGTRVCVDYVPAGRDGRGCADPPRGTGREGGARQRNPETRPWRPRQRHGAGEPACPAPPATPRPD